MSELLVGLLFLVIGLASFLCVARLSAPARRKARVWKRVARCIADQEQRPGQNSSLMRL